MAARPRLDMGSEREGGLQALPDEVSRIQLQTLDDNCTAYDVAEMPLNNIRQGVRVMGPEQGAVLPGVTVVWDSCPNPAAGALARHWHVRSRTRHGDSVLDSTEDEKPY